MRTLDDCDFGFGATGEGLRFTRLALGSSSSFITRFTPVSQVDMLLLGIRPKNT